MRVREGESEGERWRETERLRSYCKRKEERLQIGEKRDLNVPHA